MSDDPAGAREAAAPRQQRALLRYRRSRETRERIAVAASRLFSEKGYDAVTIDEICEEAGTSRSGFYFHFPTKDAVLSELDLTAARRVSSELDGRAAADRPSIEGDLDVFVDGLARRSRRVPRELLARTMTTAMKGLPRVGQLPDPDADFGRALAESFRRAQARNEIPADEDAAELGAVLAAMAMEGLLRWAHGTTAEPDLREVLRWRAEVFLSGIRHREHRPGP